MTRDTCRHPTCSNPVDGDGVGRRNAYCSQACSLKYEHVKADARDAARAEGRQ